MRVTRFEDDKNLRDLTRRLFEAKEPASGRAGMTEAEDSLADANPNLPLRGPGSLAKRIEAGAVIAVPDVPGAAHTRASQAIGDAGVAALLERTRAAIGEAARDFEADRGRSVAALEANIELINSKGFKAAAKRDETLAAALAAVQEHVRARLEELHAADADQGVALEAADQAIANLLELANRPAGGRREAPEG